MRAVGGFHPKLIGEIERTLAASVPEHYSVRLATRSYVALTDTEGKDFKPFLPDVGITTPAGKPPVNGPRPLSPR